MGKVNRSVRYWMICEVGGIELVVEVIEERSKGGFDGGIAKAPGFLIAKKGSTLKGYRDKEAKTRRKSKLAGRNGVCEICAMQKRRENEFEKKKNKGKKQENGVELISSPSSLGPVLAQRAQHSVPRQDAAQQPGEEQERS